MPDEISVSYILWKVGADDVSSINFFFSEDGDPKCEVTYFVKEKTTDVKKKSGSIVIDVTGDAKTDIIAWFNSYAKDEINTQEGFLP